MDKIVKFVFILMTMSFYKLKINCDDHEYRLLNDILRDYNRYARPSLNYKKTTDVIFGLSLSQLIDVDEKFQIITTNCWITMKWLDNKLAWNKTDYGGLLEIRLPHDKIWKPDVILYNNADGYTSLGSISTNLIVENTGHVTWLSTNIFKSSCHVNVKYFPFDQQNCSLAFASWTYDQSGINLLKLSDTGDISNLIKNGEWTLENLLVERNVFKYSCCEVPYTNITYHIIIKRRPLFYIFNMVLPSLLILFVGFLAFMIPSDSDEKTGMGVTTLLSMTVFLMVIADSMPPNSDNIPFIAAYYFATMLIISLVTTCTVFTSNVSRYGENEKPVPPSIQRLFFEKIGKFFMMNIKYDKNVVMSVNDFFTLNKLNHSNNFIDKILKPTLNHHLSINNHAEGKKSFTIKRNSDSSSSSSGLNIRSKKSPNKNIVRSKIPRDSINYIDYQSNSREMSRLVRHLNKTAHDNDIKFLIDQYRAEIVNQWKQLARILDNCFALLFLTATLLMFTITFIFFYVNVFKNY